jgi:hypothetical protein
MRVPVRWLRPALITLIVLDLLVLAAFSVHVSRTITRTVVPLAQNQSAAPALTPTTTAAPAPVAPPAGAPVVIAASVPAASAPVSAPRTSSSPPSKPPTPPPGGGTPDGPATCPIPLRPPGQQGGLQSLIDFAPAFGQFSAEAFAAASAYQPVLRLIGPILAQYPSLAPKLSPMMTPFVNALGSALNSLFGLVGPYYAPYRTHVLRAETKLAAFLAPYAQRLANSPLGGCIVDVEAALVADEKKS